MAAKSSKPRPSYRVHASPKALPSMPRPALPARRAPVFRLLPARCLRGWAAREGALAGARRAHRAPAHAPSAAHLACKIRYAWQARPCPCPLPVSRPAPPTSRLRHRGGKFVANKFRFDGNLCCPVPHELSIKKTESDFFSSWKRQLGGSKALTRYARILWQPAAGRPLRGVGI